MHPGSTPIGKRIPLKLGMVRILRYIFTGILSNSCIVANTPPKVAALVVGVADQMFFKTSPVPLMIRIAQIASTTQ